MHRAHRPEESRILRKNRAPAHIRDSICAISFSQESLLRATEKNKAHRSTLDTPLLLTSLHLNLFLRRSHRSPRLEAFPAKHRSSLRWPEWNRGFFPALRARCLRFRSHRALLPPPPPPPSARLALQPLHRFGSFLNPLSAKNICSPAVNTNSAPHSEHFNTLSWNSMSAPPGPLSGQWDGPILHLEPWTRGRPVVRECRARIPGACVRRKVRLPNVSA